MPVSELLGQEIDKSRGKKKNERPPAAVPAVPTRASRISSSNRAAAPAGSKCDTTCSHARYFIT